MKKIFFFLFFPLVSFGQSNVKEELKKNFIIAENAKKIVAKASNIKRSTEIVTWKNDVSNPRFQNNMLTIFFNGQDAIPLEEVAGAILSAKENNQLTDQQLNIFLTIVNDEPVIVFVVMNRTKKTWQIFFQSLGDIDLVPGGTKLFMQL